MTSPERPWDEIAAEIIESGTEDIRHLDGRWVGGIAIYVDRLVAERDRYRKALERIAAEGDLYGTKALEGLATS